MRKLMYKLGKLTGKLVNRIKSKDTPRKVLVSYWALESFYSAGVIIAFILAGMYIQASLAICVLALFTYAINGVVRTEI